MKISVSVSHISLDGDYSSDVEGIQLECSRCGHTVEVFGTSEASEKRGCVMLNDECLNGESNFYEVD